MILVAGGTGALGSAIARRLLDNGRAVRVMTRQRERAEALERRGARVAVADLRDRAALADACRGVTHVITTANAFADAARDSTAAVDGQGNRNLIDAARDARVRQFVYTSARVSPAYRALDYFAAKFATEDYLKASGLTWTILRPTAFMETWARIVGDPLLKAGATTIFGRGTMPVNFVAVDDVAAIAVLTLDRPDSLNQVIEIGGPENLTLLEVADIFERVTGRTGRRTHVPAPVLRVMGALVRPFNPVFARQVRAGALVAREAQPYDPQPMRARFPVRLTRLEEWVKARYGPSAAPL
jgi:uncharacterized protein YbjT (DUF2867 family)